MLEQKIDPVQVGIAIAAQLNKDIPAAQVVRAVQRYSRSFFPVARSFEYTFTAVSALSGLQSIQVDNSYGLFLTQIIGRQTSSDTDGYVEAIQLNNGYNLLPERMPFVYLTRFTAAPLDWNLYCPPMSQIQTNLRNGSTTAAATFGVTYKGYKLPTEFINELTGGKAQG